MIKFGIIGLRVIALASLLTASGAVPAHGDGGDAVDLHEQIAQAQRATAQFFDVEAAKQAGYAQFLDCVDEPRRRRHGHSHLNGELAGDAKVDALRPEALMYAPAKNGALRLVGVEYIVFQDAWDAREPQPPVLFGHPFHLVRSPSRYGVPAFYELHVWLWKHNPDGLFNDWNPRVRCR
jgi:hypothetical protein